MGLVTPLIDIVSKEQVGELLIRYLYQNEPSHMVVPKRMVKTSLTSFREVNCRQLY